MKADRHFCSDASLAAGEPLLGSATTCAELVLVSWPKGCWGDDALASAGLPDLSPWLAARSAGGKVALRLISRPGLTRDHCVAMGWPGGWRVEAPPEDLCARMDAPTTAAPPALIICTHGRHDACCARHGQELADRAREEVARRGLDLEVWESTHLGGHRFAATAIALPSGHMHGRLRPGDAAALVEHAVANAPLRSHYRGSIFLREEQQVTGALASFGTPAATLVRQTYTVPKGCGEEPSPVTRVVAAPPETPP